MTTKRAAIYMRVSTQWQADNGMSLDFQEEKLLEYVKNNKYSLDKEKHIFIDAGVSGAKEDREWLKSLMKSAHRWEIDIVLVYKIDRFFRRILPLIEYVDILADYDVWFSSINQWDFNVDSVTGKIVLPIFWALAEMERDLIRERTMEWKRKKADMGYYVGWWKPPFGYEFDKSPQWNKLKVVVDEKRVVNKIFELYAKERKTLWEVAKILERDWELTRDDKIMALWEQKTKKVVSGRWHPTVISRILKEERYIGKYYYGKTQKVTNRKTRKVEIKPSPPEHMIELSCEPILEDFSLFEKAQELLELNKRTKNTKTGYPLTGLMFCSHCGKNYVWYKHSKNKETYSYRCNGIFKSPDNALKKYYNEKKSHSDIAKFQKQVQKLEELIKKHNGWIKDAIKLQIDAAAENRPIYDEVIDEKRVHIREAENGIRELEQKIESLKNLEYAKNNLYRLKEYYDEKIKNITDEKKIEIVQELVYRVLVNFDGSTTILYKFQEHDDEWDDGEWKKPQKWENTFQDELDNDAPFEAIKNFGQNVKAFTTTTIIFLK